MKNMMSVQVLLVHYIAIGIIFCTTDYFISIVTSSQYLRKGVVNILLDESCHASIAALMWSSILVRDSPGGGHGHHVVYTLYLHIKQHLHSIIAAGVAGSIVDIDHFISAKSLSVFDATHLSSRPFGHSVAFVLLVSSLVYFFCGTNKDIRTCLVFTSLMAHQLRDAVRRGLWLWPFGSTSPIATYLVFLLYISISLLVRHRLIDSAIATSKLKDSSNVSSYVENV